MSSKKTVNLLPEIFRTNTNKKFLAATLDQLTQEPNFKRTQGYVGRKVGPGVNLTNNYVVEPTKTRSDYQLEPGVTFLKTGTNTAEDAITYPGMIDVLKLQGADVTRQDRLWQSQYYSWDPFCDFDKFSNYSQYYWLPSGPLSVDVSTTTIPLSDDFTVTRNPLTYEFTGIAGTNPIITLARGGNYNFIVNQPGNKFWIQAAPGIAGQMPYAPNISSRDVFGVVNNGEDQGTVEFYVPLKTAQDFYYNLNQISPVDLVCNLNFNQINNIYVSAFLEQYPTGIDGITQLDGLTLIFTNTIQDAEEGGWQITTQYDPLPSNAQPGAIGTFDSVAFDQTTDINVITQRYSVWQINYVYDNDGRPFITLSSMVQVPNLSRFNIRYGETNSSTQWYKNASGYYQQVPLLTATLDTLYYQDSTNPEIFGEIRLVDAEITQPIDVDEIIGAKNYISPNGVKFTNGLKVQFRGLTNPPQYQNLEFYVEGVGTGLGRDLRVGFVDGQAYFGAFHVYQGQKMTGATYTGEFQQYIYDTVAESLLNIGAGSPEGAPLPTASIPGAALGNGIKLIPVNELITPETYTKSALIPYDSTSYDVGSYDASLNAPLIPDYLTINRASNDRNAWSRSNRWFHIDVINYSAEINNITPTVDNNQRAKRPIIEFRANTSLFNFGTQGKQAVNIVDFSSTDALSNINGTTGYGVDGYTFIQGTRVIFAADTDQQVRNRIYEVTFIDPNNTGTLVIDLVPVTGGLALINQTVVSINGATQQGLSYWFDGVIWQPGQQKNSVNQAPLFDVYDTNGISFSNRITYPSTTFAGSKLFSYADGETAIQDDVLGLSLKYFSINNVGDILFSNYLYNDTFIYVKNNVSTTAAISTGFARQYLDRVAFSNELGWQPAAATTRSRQIFRFVNTGTPLILDVPVDQLTVFPPIQIFVDGIFVDPLKYTYTVTGNTTTIVLSSLVALNSVIEVQALSNVASQIGFYQVPINLENNAINGNSKEFTLGTIRTHYETIGQNLRNLVGLINGANNTRDLGELAPYGTQIIQNSAPLVLPGVFMRRQQFELFNSLAFNGQEYNKYKALLIDYASHGDFVNLSPTQILDASIQEITLARSSIFPFYWSDMLPAGETYTELTYTYSQISTNTFTTNQVYNFTQSNFKAILVYLNGEILTKGYDYTVPAESASVIITTTLAVGDVITIREYATTYGSYVPNTPTKMGLYPAYEPKLFYQETSTEPTLVIQGHDGSITVAFNDFRDNVLLEFETRIFNNLKIDTQVPLLADDVIPGQFRTTDYTLEEINSILLPDFLAWAGANKLDYTSQSYSQTNPFTYNYSQSSNRLDGQPLLGAWRGNYIYFYDTATPNTTPWEMLGFTQQPSWWETRYGPAPYTSGNLVLWQDLERGYIADPVNPRIDPCYVRPGLLKVIPSGSEGQLLDPLFAVVGNYDATSFRRSWAFGDDGPVENTWRSSSSWPFAVMRLLALTRPAKFFSLFADRDQYVFDEGIDQYLWNGRYRLQASNIAPLYGNGVSRASYINWIIDYNQQLGVNSSDNLTTVLSNLDIRLCWRLASFSDKRYLKLYTERSTPTGSNAGLLLPDESYSVLLYKNPPAQQTSYSSVIVQVTDTGWAVLGYNGLTNYFEILASKVNGKTQTISAGGSTEQVPTEYTNTVVRVPYGFVFTNRSAVCDFLLSYGKLLTDRGFVFDRTENGYIMDWSQMAQEFLYWSNQGWGPNSIINLNPGANVVSITTPGQVAESLQPVRLDNVVLNQNRQGISPNDLVIDRLENTFTINSLNSNTINFLNLRFTAYEHLIVLDNRSIFADLIYDPITGGRQSRILMSGYLSGDWNGTVNAPGFILNQPNIKEWIPNQKYTKGEIVEFKNQYWSAGSIIQPTAKFDYSNWIKSDYSEVMQGLLPNAANESNQLAQAYSVYDANLETDVDLFSYGLIGFRPREYMAALNLDDVSQVQLYQQFLGSKGTRPSLEIFTFADLGKETAQYNLYEYWAMLRSVYGANANNSFFELLLNEAKLPSDPSLIQVIQPGTTSKADQTVFVNDIWKSSYKITSPSILPTTTTTPTDVGFPSAGYVNLNDVDITLFDLTNPSTANSSLDKINVGTTLWVAKVNAYNWNVYRVTGVPNNILRVEDNLNGASIVTFAGDHGLTVGDILIIKNFDTDVNGFYRVKSVPTLTTLIIDYTFVGEKTFVTGIGLGLTLQSSRVAQPSDIIGLPYANQLLPGIKVWVDNNGHDRWTVLEKINPFYQAATIDPTTPEIHSEFGYALAQGFENLSAIVGAPGYNPNDLATDPGVIYTYVLTDQNVYEQNSIIELNATNAARYGSAVDVGNQQWAVVGASASNNYQGYATTIYLAPGSSVFEQRQLLVAPDQDFGVAEFGHAVTVSKDERWMYITAPSHNKVYAYTRVDVQRQTVSYTTDGETTTYNWNNHIVIDYAQPEQLVLALDNVLLQYGIDYTVDSTSITLTAIPESGKVLIITRRPAVQLDQQTYYNIEQDSTTGSGTGAQFTINRVRGDYYVDLTLAGQDYQIGDTLTIDAATIGGGTSPANDLVITVTATGNDDGISALTYSGSGVDNTSVFALDQYLYTATNIYSFTVKVNDQLYRPHLDYDFNSDSTYQSYDLVFNTVPPAGAVISVSSGSYFSYVSTLAVPGLDVDSRFGQSVACTTTGNQVTIGSPDADQNAYGKVYAFDRNIERFIVTDNTQTNFYPVNDLTDPGYVAVTLNGEFLVNTEMNIDGTFTVDTSDLLNQFVTITAPLAVGDVIQIETNQFTQLQTIVSSNQTTAAAFGSQLDQCVNDCSLYVASPGDSAILIEAGKVEVFRNQARLYGTIESTVANPVLSAGDYIRINNMFVAVPAAPNNTVQGLIGAINTTPYLSTKQYYIGDRVSYNNLCYVATASTLANNPTNTAYWAPSEFIPNVSALLTSNLTLEGDGTSTVFDVGSIYSAAESYTTKVYVNDVLQTYSADYTYNNSTQQITFVTPPFNTANILIVSGRMIITVKNINSAQPTNKLSVLPGAGSVFFDLGFNVYAWQQEIVSPDPQSYAHFGSGLFVSDDALTLMVGAPNGSTIAPTIFDNDTTTFDLKTTQFADPIIQSGAVYSYDVLPAVNPSVSNPPLLVFGQQFINSDVQTLDQFGAAIDYTTGVFLIGAPGSDIGDSSQSDYGKVVQYYNDSHGPAWAPTRIQEPTVDVALLDTVFIYDLVTGAPKQYLDYFNPLQGRLLGAVRQNLNYIGAVDPAAYNAGTINNYGMRWGQGQVGQIWWDTSFARFIDPNQDDIVYASRRWGQLFPGSSVDVYQWIASSEHPVNYTGEGTVHNIESYVETTMLNESGFLNTEYFFWVKGIRTVATTAGKTLSAVTLSQYIESPKSSGISYIAPINSSTIAIYNSLPYISAQDTVLHIEFDKQATESVVHAEYQLIPQDRPEGFLDPALYRKFLDSLTGADAFGRAVPDPMLSPSQRYGVDYRPRQSMVVNRFLALQNYITRANSVLAQYPISEIRKFTLLNSVEKEPTAGTGAWDLRVANFEELSYQNLNSVPLGYKYLVASDSTNNGLWTIYQTINGAPAGTITLELIRVQNYDTRKYWSYIDWYRPGYNPLTRILIKVPNRSALDTITVPNGSSVEVLANSQGKREVYLRENSNWVRVGLQDGTIEISATLWDYNLGRFGFDSEVFDAQYFDESPITETRKILEAINQELLIGELLIERNQLLVLMFNYILSEQRSPVWLSKTSLIDVDHVIRELLPYPIYRRDNQDFVLNYINEVKPYHVQIREFNLKYQGLDAYPGSIVDFDLPAYWDPTQELFISPVLDNTDTMSTTSSLPSTNVIWQTFPWNQWYQNYLLSIQSVTVVNSGLGYTSPPTVIVTGDCVQQAVMEAQINSAGQVTNITVIDPGLGYTTAAIITLTEGNGTGATAVAVMGNQQVRNILTTLRYDRYQYTSNVLDWQANVDYVNGTLVRYDNRVWEATSGNNDPVNSATFDPDQWTLIAASALSGVDRTMGYYVPRVNEPGLDLALLISGVDYPGVQVAAPSFDRNTGYDVGNFDINPFDNISYGPDGYPTYDPAILDAIYESNFTDPYLGILPAPAYDGAPPTTGPANAVTVDGGAFVDTYESHAPEELVPGIVYDTLDMRVFTTPGADWLGLGHGSPEASVSYFYSSSIPTYSFANLLPYPMVVVAYNVTQGLAIQPTAYDWANYQVEIGSGAVDGDIIMLEVTATGGGNQLYSNTYLGADIVDSTIIIPFPADMIDSFVIYNGENYVLPVDYTLTPIDNSSSLLTLTSTYSNSDRITLTVLGYATTGTTHSWSLPVIQTWIADGGLTVPLTNSLQGTNPINLIVTRNGARARPSESVRYIGDNIQTVYDLPSDGGYSQGIIANNDVSVYVDNTALVLGTDFIVNTWDGSTLRTVSLTNAPPVGAVILVAVRTAAQYWVNGNILEFKPSAGLVPQIGDVIEITTWNDTSEQGLLTQLFVGPTTQGELISQGYDDTVYDDATVNNTLGSFDYSTGIQIAVNIFETGRVIDNPERLVVTLNGKFLFNGRGFTASGSKVIISGPPISASAVVVITSTTQSVVPEAMAFRIFQDMRGIQSTYRITSSTTTQLVGDLLATDDIIHVANASALSEPYLEQGLFGLVTINGERISYRTRNTTTNTLSGLRRGTAGTAAADHLVGAQVYDIGIGNYLDQTYQNHYLESNYLGDGSTATFTTEFVLQDLTPTELDLAVQVFVGGTLQQTGYTVDSANPVAVTFATAPTLGYQVTIRITQGLSWYQPGPTAPSDGVPLQETDTRAAQFLRGN